MMISQRRAPSPANAQRGVVMFVALVVLVAMALAAVALIRSVDTTTAVVGNLGFRQASVLPSNVAVEEAVAALFEKNTIADKNTNLPSENYFSTKQAGEDSRGVPAQLQKRSSFSLARVLKPNADYEVRYVIERMCREPRNEAVDHCDMILPFEARGGTEGNPNVRNIYNERTYYRLTIRVDGPRNTTSFVRVMLRRRP